VDNKRIGYIKEGIVIDHIPHGQVYKIANLLSVDTEREGRVSLGDGYGSKKIGKKGILKIEGASISKDQLNLIALVANNANISFIKNGRVSDKKKVRIPLILENVILCNNPNCITNDSQEKVLSIIYYNENKELFSCHYCTKEFLKKDFKFVNIN